MDTNQNYSKTNKIELSLSALMFFSPIIQYTLKNRNDISSDDKNFIQGFIKMGYINIILLVITIIFGIINYYTQNMLFKYLSNITLVILLLFLSIGSIYAIIERPISKNTHTNLDDDIDKTKILLSYIPIYNVYLRYKNHDFESESIELKESLVVWGILSLLLLLPLNKYIFMGVFIIFLMLWLARIIGFNFGIKYNSFISSLFKKNPEEIRGGLVGIIKTPFSKQSLNENIESKKLNYSLIFKYDHKQILLEYIILLILIMFGIYIGIKYEIYTFLIGILLILCRYLLMLIKWKHLPHIPVLREITSLFFKKN